MSSPCIAGPIPIGTLGGTYTDVFQLDSLSNDGSVVAGMSYLAGDAVYRAFRWTSASGMLDLGTLGGTNSGASAMSRDGSVACLFP